MKDSQVKSTDDDKQGNLDDLGERATQLIAALAPPSNPQGQSNPDSAAVSLQDILARCNFPSVAATQEEKQRIHDLQAVTTQLEEKSVPRGAFRGTDGYQIDYKTELNPRQLAAVSSVDMPSLVIAGAGSGKTRVITYKVAYLIEKGVLPSQILLLTFTRKAAHEMLDRVKQLLGKDLAKGVLGGTFHFFANYVLRRYGSLADVQPNFTIMDTGDCEDTISMLKEELDLNVPQGKSFPPKTTIQKIISRARNTQLSIDKIVHKHFLSYKDCIGDIEHIARVFQAYKQKHNVFDYDDLMDVLCTALARHSTFRAKLHSVIKYVLVDEYQDTNNIQREIVALLVGDRNTVTVVGDDTQSIYSFRGANYENILRFPQSFPNCECVKIEQNYRSGQELLNFTNAIAAQAQVGFKKSLHAPRYVGHKPQVRIFPSAMHEAEFVADSIVKIRGNDLSYSDFAVLTRSGFHSKHIQVEFMQRKIPYVVVGGIKFSESRHVRDVLAFLKILQNPIDAVAWHRVLKLIRNIGDVRASEIITAIKASDGNIDVSSFADRDYYPYLKKYEAYYLAANADTSPAQAIADILKFYTELLKQNEKHDHDSRLKDLQILAVISSKYGNIEKFLSDFYLEPPNRWQDGNTPQEGEEEKAVTISTIHSAKGLEWHTVFIPFALDGIIPSCRSLSSLEELEEERRVFYVAASRAKENLFVTMPASVARWGKVFTLPSRFLKEIDARCYATSQ